MFNIKGSNVLLVMHRNPDVDAIASCFITSELVKQKYPSKPVYILLKSKFRSYYFKEFDEIGHVILFEHEIPQDTTVYLLDHHDREYSLLDNGNNDNIKEFIVIDHHFDIKTVNKDKDNPVKPIEVPIKSFIDTNKTSTAHVIYEALKGMNTVEITKDIANYIYTGIYSDCMRFSIPIDLSTHKLIVELADKYGADLDDANKFCSARTIWGHRNFATGGTENIAMASVHSRVATIKVNLATYLKLKATGDKPYSILFDVLMCRRVHHVLMIVQTGKNRGLIKVCSRYKNAVSEALSDCFKDKVYTETVFTGKKVLEMQEAIIRHLDQGDMKQGFAPL